MVREESWGPDFVCVLAQVFFHPELELSKLVAPELSSGSQIATQMVRNLLTDVPAQTFNDRAQMTYHQGTYVLARWVQENGPVTDDNAARFTAVTRNAIDFLAAGVQAPVGARRARTSK